MSPALATLKDFTKSRLLKGKAPRKEALTPPPMTMAEAREILAAYADLLEKVQAEREGMDRADEKLRKTSSVNLGDAFLAGEALPDLHAIRSDYEGSKLRARVSYEAASGKLPEVLKAQGILSRHWGDCLLKARNRLEEELRHKLKEIGVQDNPSLLPLILAATAPGRTLLIEESNSLDWNIPAIMGALPVPEGTRKGIPRTMVPMLPPWRIEPVPEWHREKGIRAEDQWSPRQSAASIRGGLKLVDDAELLAA